MGQLIEELRRICELQPAYAPENTDAMQERGQLIRHELPAELRGLQTQLAAALGPFGDDFDVGASDGIGRKTEAPWVRIFSRSMSPTPRSGFYVVIHFAANGSAVFITVGCGSTVWANGELRSESDQELRRRTDWARGVITEAFGSLAPFQDEIFLGARAPLPRTFEKATAVARRLPVDQLRGDEFTELLIEAARRLRAIYDAQRVGRDQTTADAIELEIDAISRPRQSGGGQGFGLTGPERKAVEQRAMVLAREWLEGNGYSVTDTSLTSPFDFLARRDDVTLKVEVKGTTSDMPDAIFMTRNEVNLHQDEAGSTALFIVSKIRLLRSAEGPTASGGELVAEIGWNIRDWDMVPVAFRLSRGPTPRLP